MDLVPGTVMIIAVILARAESKRIPHKNMRLLAGHPLIVWTLEAARRSQVDRIVTSSDDEGILDLAKDFGETIRRPRELATDHAPDAPAIRHVLEATSPPSYRTDDVILHLRPTAPFRHPKEIDQVADLLRVFPCDSVVSVRPAMIHPRKCYLETGKTIEVWPELRPACGSSGLGEASQNLPPAWEAAGFIDGTKVASFLIGGRMDFGTILGWPAPRDRALDIDTEEDWQKAAQFARDKDWIPGALDRPDR